jgi:ATP adenylyltransferase
VATVEYEQIWAPWRLGYILGEKDAPHNSTAPDGPPGTGPACFLCQCRDEADDRQRAVVQRREHSITLLNRFPYNNGHLLVAPRSHVGRLEQLTAEEQGELTETISQMVLLLERVLQPHGFNVGLNLGRVAGAGLPDHLHWHIVPRWSGDTNFMPVVAGIRVIPQSLDALWEALTQELARAREP